METIVQNRSGNYFAASGKRVVELVGVLAANDLDGHGSGDAGEIASA